MAINSEILGLCDSTSVSLHEMLVEVQQYVVHLPQKSRSRTTFLEQVDISTYSEVCLFLVVRSQLMGEIELWVYPIGFQ